jgi:quercetin dioxygenase-like cupin family protein
MSRIHVMTSIVAVAALAVMIAGRSQTISAAQRGQSTFTGGTPTTVDSAAVHTSRLRFPKGSRSNWHTHVSGQLLMIEEGKGLTQVRGGPLKEMLPGQPWWTPAGVEHWHGAAPDQDALQLTIYEGAVNWLEPVGDKEYLATPAK